MVECKNCYHEKVCKYADETVSVCSTVRDILHECINYVPCTKREKLEKGVIDNYKQHTTGWTYDLRR